MRRCHPDAVVVASNAEMNVVVPQRTSRGAARSRAGQQIFVHDGRNNGIAQRSPGRNKGASGRAGERGAAARDGGRLMAASRVRPPPAKRSEPVRHLIYKSRDFLPFRPLPISSHPLTVPAALVVVQADPVARPRIAPGPLKTGPSSTRPASARYCPPGDIVAVSNSGVRREGLVVGSHIDYAGRQVVEVQLDGGEIYNAWYPSVTRVRRTIQYTRPLPQHKRTIERTIYW
ncbi:hypothetical protein BC628DRAFT_352760 [Trametes gibbosa]|nr:hypothetical protein BC628DRAFT_352760 [Trametes gibbosa]